MIYVIDSAMFMGCFCEGAGCCVVLIDSMSPVFTCLCIVGAVELSCGDEFSVIRFVGVVRNLYSSDGWGL